MGTIKGLKYKDAGALYGAYREMNMSQWGFDHGAAFNKTNIKECDDKLQLLVKNCL